VKNEDPSEWSCIRVSTVDTSGWLVRARQDGLRELERILRETHAAMVELISSTPPSRDKVADIARTCGVSAGEARQRRNVATVYDKVPGAGDLLRSGAVSPEHLASLEPVADRARHSGTPLPRLSMRGGARNIQHGPKRWVLT
jgi:hypothetical protein